MNRGAPEQVGGKVRITPATGSPIELPPQELWRLTDEARRFLLANWASFDDAPVREVTKNGRTFTVRVTPNIDFWERLEKGTWEPSTFTVLDAFATPDTNYLDVGGWIGPTALYAAQRARQAHAFEPDPVAYRELDANLRANRDREWASRLQLHNKAVSSSDGTLKLGSQAGGGDSQSSVFFSEAATSWEVEMISLRRFIEDNGLGHDPLFIKMDIEGAEYGLLPSLKGILAGHNVVLYLSLHPHLLMDSLAAEAKPGLTGRISRRLCFAWRHLGLVRALPFAHFYTSEGRPISLSKELLKALLKGVFIRDIVATHRPWGKG